ncbi:MAG: DNA methyltransferase [Verrucomicrobiota bacterium]|jgi:tRNA G10  N-methylase Trm11
MNLFKNFDFGQLDSPDFKEDSVREILILPILEALGYKSKGPNQIIRSRTLKHPFVKIGSTDREVKITPDYLLETHGKPLWVLDAKSPSEEIRSGTHPEQVYSYAIHPEIRATCFALCNGREFVVFQANQQSPVLAFHLQDMENYWTKLVELLGPTVPRDPALLAPPNRVTFDYMACKLPSEITSVKRQDASRHYGVHGYFTKQAWNIVQEYIRNFTQPGDLVLDPFGGSGVTLVEALMVGRAAIHVDINPHSIFLVENLVSPVNLSDFAHTYEKLRAIFLRNAPKTKEEIKIALKRYPYPKGYKLPSNSDVDYVEELFSAIHLAQLAYLKHLIMSVRDKPIRGVLLLMFSGALNKLNLTYHASAGRSSGRGDSAIFKYYRYRIAPKPGVLQVIDVMNSRLRKVIKAKRELAPIITRHALENAQIVKGDAADLSWIPPESVDYIYTDPPYGSKIPYLDLSVMWTSWLGLKVTKADLQSEIIEGGEAKKSKASYFDLLSKSIAEMGRVLKFDRWMSFVFAHDEPAYWHAIINAAEAAGFEYVGVTKQDTDKTSFKKRQNPFTTLQGTLIINFKKVRNPKTMMKMSLGAKVSDIITNTIESAIAENDGATVEQINDRLVISGLEMGFLDVLAKEYKSITPILQEWFDYDSKSKKYHIKREGKFKALIALDLRVRYFILSYLRRMELRGEQPTFDEIVLHIMPLLKNGDTPEQQTILNVLENIADRTQHGRWKIKPGNQTVFNL